MQILHDQSTALFGFHDVLQFDLARSRGWSREPDSDLRPNVDILCFSYQTSSWFGKVVFSPAQAMWRAPVLCWNEVARAGRSYKSLLWLAPAAAGGLGVQRPWNMLRGKAVV